MEPCSRLDRLQDHSRKALTTRSKFFLISHEIYQESPASKREAGGGVAEEEHLFGGAHVDVRAPCSPEHVVSGRVSVCPCALSGTACPPVLAQARHACGVQQEGTRPGRLWETLSVLDTCPSQPPARLSLGRTEAPLLRSPLLPGTLTMGTPTRRKSHLLMLAAVALVSTPAWSSAWGSPATFGPVFEDQPLGLLFPEESTEEKLVGGNLVIMNPTKAQDAGVYQCLASNPVGTVVSREAVLRFGCEPHGVPGRFGGREERAGKSVQKGRVTTSPWSLSWRGSPRLGGQRLSTWSPPPVLQEFSKEERDPVKTHEGLSYRWLLNEFPNFIPTDGRHFVSQTTGNLYIARTNASDLGNYSCLATSHMDFSTKSVFSKFAQLNLAAEDTRLFAPSIKARFPAETYALVGQQVTLECFAFGNPVPRIKWRKVDGSLSPQWATAEPTLQIPSVGFEDEGTYECEAENSKGRDTVQGRIIVQDMEADIGSNLHWECAAAGKPRPTVRWLRDGDPLASQARVEVLAGDLRFSKLSLEDSGMYQCVAENKHGTIYASAELAVQALAPDFRLNPVRRLIPAARGGEIVIPCQPRAAPKAVVLWSKGTEILVNSSRVTVTPDGTLIIRNISRSDEGKYTCFAENFMGKANSTGILSVRDATKITLAPSSADINSGDNLTLQCHASHDPTMDLTFIWTLDDFPIDFDKPGGHYRRASVKETVGDLTILNAQLRHGGKYTCMAQTVVDSASKEATVLVRGPPGPPGGVVVRDIGDTTVQLSWSRGFDNHSPIAKYTLQARTLPAGKWKQVRTNPANIEGNAETAQVLGLTPWMDYEFRVSASNILGTGEPSGPSSKIRTKEAAPSVAPSGLRGGGGAPGELIVNWTTARVPGADAQYFVYSNESVRPYTPFEVKIRSYNHRGDGPESLTAIVYSAEEGGPPRGPCGVPTPAACPRGVGWRSAPHTPAGFHRWGGEDTWLPSQPSLPRLPSGLAEGGSLEREAVVTECSGYNCFGQTSRKRLAKSKGLHGDPLATSLGLSRAPVLVLSGTLWSRSEMSLQSQAISEKLVQEPGPGQQETGGVKRQDLEGPEPYGVLPFLGLGKRRISPGMLYQNDLHPIPTLHLTSKNWIEIAVPEDIGHALVQIRTTGPGGDGVPAEVHIVRNGGAVSPLIPQEYQGPSRCLMQESFPPKPDPNPASPQGGKKQAGRNQVQSSPGTALAAPSFPLPNVPEGREVPGPAHSAHFRLLVSGTSMMVENSAGCPVPHPGTVLCHSVATLILIGYLEL
ncbi:hypothetical protein E2I00_005187 [Balaenoptera physalus]|uniref:Axonal glycoprotein TAG-1 n=1 Tax=Balaenoptera physalus TaxID=9770 RepID=A0A643BVZ4_BALPH|nr:hypothetical protein E2I00_005187 [Balaenoptera physalus]